MSDYKVDRSLTNTDGDNTISGPDRVVQASIVTPATAKGQEWSVANNALMDGNVAHDSSANITFGTAVSDVSFTLFDVDGFDEITIMTKNADGNPVEVEFEVTSQPSINGNAVVGTANNNTGAQDINVAILGPIKSFWIVMYNGRDRFYSSTVKVGDIGFRVADTPDGYANGTDGSDTIDNTYISDPDSDRINYSDAVLPGERPNDDIVLAGGGDGVVVPRSGNDEVYDESGNDILFAGRGDNAVSGGNGNDVVFGGDGDDTLIGGNRLFDGTQDFNDLSAGDLIDGQFIANGVLITSADPRTPVIVFETANPTDSDGDLATSNLGNVLILSEDRHSSDPDDNASGGTFNIEFENPASVTSLTLLDADGGATVTYFELNGGEIGSFDVRMADNGQIVLETDFDNVGSIDVTLVASGAIDNLTYFINPGNMDGNHVIAGGDDDDIIGGNAGDHMIFGCTGHDVLVGGGGADVLEGGDDKDTLFADADDVTVDGGAGGDDFDILDLTGQGPFFLNGAIKESNGNGIDGTVVFLDVDGNPTGKTLNFTEIEQVVGGDVNRDPDAINDMATVVEDEVVTITVLGNEINPDGDMPTVTDATSPNGDVAINSDGTITFIPVENFNGDTTITYTVDDGNGGTDTAIVAVTVNPVNDYPIAFDDAGETDENTAIAPDNALENDIDVDGDMLTVSLVAGETGNVGDVVAGDNGGLITINADGSALLDPNDEFNGLAAGETAETVVPYAVTDLSGGSDITTVIVTVTGTNDAPVANDDCNTTGFNETITVDLLADAVVFDTGDILTVVSATVSADQGTLVDNEDGTVTFTPVAGFIGDATISYTIEDEQGLTASAVHTIVLDAGIPDRTVSGTDSDDRIDVNFSLDPDGDLIDNNDAIAGNAGSNEDIVEAGDCDDTVIYGDGDDTIFGGNDGMIFGGAGDDSIDGGSGDDFIATAEGNDSIVTGDDDDSISGGAGNDTIDAGFDDDIVEGGDGDDTMIANEGIDETSVNHGNDLIFGGLVTSGAADALNQPDDINGDGDGICQGEDLVTFKHNDTLFGDASDNTIFGADDDDILFGGANNDVLNGGVDDDEQFGDEGDDILIDGQGDDTLIGGEGSDELTGGIGVDEIDGGLGSDTSLGGNAGNVVVGGKDPDNGDVDVLDLMGSGVDFITYVDDDPEAGTITFLDGSTMMFSEIENVVPCFTPGTRIATPKGERLVEELREGDRIITRDNGIQEIRWVGRKEMSAKSLLANPHLKPILFRAGSLGNDLPERDMLVSPNHRVLVASEKTQLYFEEREVLAAAKHLVGAEGIRTVDVMGTSYVHFMFDRHEVVLSNGSWTESFQPGDYALRGIGNSQRNEIFELFPELQSKTGREGYQSARRALNKFEAKLLEK